MISVVCVYNDKQVLQEYLESSLDVQTSSLEKILIDNSQNKYESAAKALNEGAARANGKYILFIHQDVRFYPETWLSDAENMLDSLQKVGIAGVAGKKDRSGVITLITHGDPPRLAGSLQLTEPLRVQTVDECLFFVPREVFLAVNLDEHTCDDWHLYSVEYSLSIQEMGLAAYVLPLHVHHKSMGRISEAYYTVLKKIIAKHKRYYSAIYTTNGDWITLIPVKIQRACYSPRRTIREFKASLRAR